MSRQSKNRHHGAMARSIKGLMAGKHFAENQQRMKCPHQQPAPVWLKAANTKKRSWWNKKGTHREASQQNA